MSEIKALGYTVAFAQKANTDRDFEKLHKLFLALRFKFGYSITPRIAEQILSSK